MIKKRRALPLLGALLAVMLLAAPAAAGGWSAVKLDSLPRSILAGDPLTITFVVLQHGDKPLTGLDTRVEGIHRDSGETFSVSGRPLDEAGRYVADLVFRQAGRWEWSIFAFEGEHPMPPLQVAAAGSGAPGGQTVYRSGLLAGALVAALFVGISLRRRPRVAFAAAALLVAMGGIGVVSDAGEEPLLAEPMLSAEADYGAALFVAKGCASCHVHAGNPYTFPKDSFGYIGAYNTGPNLTAFQADPAYLAAWLRAPASIRPQTAMPDLQLSDEEVAALIAFLNRK